MELKKVQDIKFERYNPSLFGIYGNCYKKGQSPDYCSIKHIITMWIKWISSPFYIIYMKKGDDTVGHLVVNRGGKTLDTTSKDIIIGPIWIVPEYRGKGYATLGISTILHDLDIEYENAYEFISKVNNASIRTVEKNGFKYIGTVKREGKYIKTFRFNESGGWNVYKYENKQI